MIESAEKQVFNLGHQENTRETESLSLAVEQSAVNLPAREIQGKVLGGERMPGYYSRHWGLNE
jgi:hypothetical protein